MYNKTYKQTSNVKISANIRIEFVKNCNQGLLK